MKYFQLFAIALASSIAAPLLIYAAQDSGADNAALLQRRLQEESITLEQKHSRSLEDPAMTPAQRLELRQLNADQRTAQERLQQRQLQLRAAEQQAERAMPNRPSAPQPSLQTQILDRERQQQDLSFDEPLAKVEIYEVSRGVGCPEWAICSPTGFKWASRLG